jgi:hypothetical protein
MAKKKKGSKRSKGRKSGRLTRKEIKRAGGIKQAWAARRGKTKSPRKAGRKSRKPSHKAPKRSKARKSRKGSRRGGRSSSRSSSNRSNTRIVKSTIVRHLPGHTVAVTPVPPASRRGRKGGKRRKARKGGSRKGRKGRKSGRRKAREGYAMENPLSPMELAVGLFTGALGFGVSDFVDRYVATHALVDKNAKDAAGNELYSDVVPTTGGAAGYQGLFNGTAVLAPMNLPRWGVGVGLAVVPFVAAAFVKAPAGRSALQMFGFGAALRTVGKGLGDLVAMLTAKTAVGQRLYDDRMRAAALQAESAGGTWTVPSGSLVSAGLGAPPVACKGCGKSGMGACCSSCATKGQQASVPQSAPPPPPPPAPPANLVPPPAPTATLTGVSGANGVAAPAYPKKNIHSWGNDASE